LIYDLTKIKIEILKVLFKNFEKKIKKE